MTDRRIHQNQGGSIHRDDRRRTTSPGIVLVGLMLITCALGQVPVDLQRSCSAFDQHQQEVNQLTKDRDKFRDSVPGENPLEKQARGANYSTIDTQIKQKEKTFRDASASLIPGGTVSGWIGTLQTFFNNRISGLLDVQIELNCAGGPTGKILVGLTAVDDKRLYSINEAHYGGLPQDSPIIDSMRSIHTGDKVRISGRLVQRPALRRDIRFTAQGGLVPNSLDLSGYVVLTSIERVALAVVEPAPPLATAKPPSTTASSPQLKATQSPTINRPLPGASFTRLVAELVESIDTANLSESEENLFWARVAEPVRDGDRIDQFVLPAGTPVQLAISQSKAQAGMDWSVSITKVKANGQELPFTPVTNSQDLSPFSRGSVERGSGGAAVPGGGSSLSRTPRTRRAILIQRYVIPKGTRITFESQRTYIQIPQ